MNYGELKLLVASYAHRTDLTDEIPDFIELARQRINRDLRVQEMITLSLLTPTGNPEPLPSSFLQMREVSYAIPGGRRQLSSIGRHQLNRYPGSASGIFYYSIFGKNIQTVGDCTGTELQLIYYAEEAAFVSDTDERETLTRFPMIWLYGSLMELYSYVEDRESQAMAMQMYTGEVEQANRVSNVSELGESPQMQGASLWV